MFCPMSMVKGPRANSIQQRPAPGSRSPKETTPPGAKVVRLPWSRMSTWSGYRGTLGEQLHSQQSRQGGPWGARKPHSRGRRVPWPCGRSVVLVGRGQRRGALGLQAVADGAAPPGVSAPHCWCRPVFADACDDFEKFVLLTREPFSANIKRCSGTQFCK